MKLENGDPFERKHAGWIRKNLPSYEEVWSAFIGHDGHGAPCPMPGLDPDQQANRELFYQAHYSFVAKLMSVRMTPGQFLEDLGQVTDETMEEATQRLFNLMSAVGYIRDMFKQMDEALGAKKRLYGELQGFYSERSHVLHGPRLPYVIDDGLVMIPKVGGVNELETEWTSRSRWGQIPKKQLVHIYDFVENLDFELHSAVVAHHGKVFNVANKFFGGARIDTTCVNATPDGPVSGTTGTQSFR